MCNTEKTIVSRGICGSCKNKLWFASKTPEEQLDIKEKGRRRRIAWAKQHPEATNQYMKKYIKTHPEQMTKHLIQLARFKQGTQVNNVLQRAGIDTEFMRGQIEEHRKNKLNMRIELAMKLMF